MVAPTKRKFSGADISLLMERAIEEDGVVIINRPGRKDLAVLPAERLRDVDTTAYLLASPKNRRRLLAALERSRRGAGKRMTIEQLRKAVGLKD